MAKNTEFVPVTPSDLPALTGFLQSVDLTLGGLESPGVRLWIERRHNGEIVGSTGYEISSDRRHVLIRSVAVHAALRSSGRGARLARFAIEKASEESASTAWLFSRRSGPFWQSLGFAPADKDELADALKETHQVRLFRETGQFAGEVAWSLNLSA